MLKVSTFNRNQLSSNHLNTMDIYTVVDDINTIKNPNPIFKPKQIIQITPNIKIYPVLYTLGESIDVQDTNMTNLRFMTVDALFQKWTQLGYNTRNAKSPFSSRVFQKYLDDIDYTSADYIITQF